MEKMLAKISKAEFGLGGYQECQIGLTLYFESGSTGVGTFDGDWALKRSEHAQWTEASRITRLGEAVMRLNDTLEKAKVKTVSQLTGKPVELTLEGNSLKSWRILEEVL